ncbi:hypothetical protein ACWGNM_06065 [Streptomyces sp. NPDC055796]
MTFTDEDLVWAAARMLAWLFGALVLCGIAIVVTVAITVTVKAHRKSPRRPPSAGPGPGHKDRPLESASALAVGFGGFDCGDGFIAFAAITP